MQINRNTVVNTMDWNSNKIFSLPLQLFSVFVASYLQFSIKAVGLNRSNKI